MESARQSLAGKLVDLVFVVTVGVLLYAGKVNEWAGVFLLAGIAQARGAVGVTGKLAGLLGAAPPSGGPPPSDPTGGAGSSSASSGGRGAGLGGMFRMRLPALALTSAVVLAGSSMVGPALAVASRARAVGVLVALALGAACVGAR